MQMLAKGPGAGWSWLMAGFKVLGRDTGKVLGASALLLLCVVVVSAAQMLLPVHGDAKLAVVAATAVVGALLYPILFGGFMRLLDASHHGRPTSALMLFEPFQPGKGGARLALFGLCMLLIYAAFLALLLTTVGRELWSWYLQVLNMQPALGSPPQPLPHLAAGSALSLALLTVFFVFYGGAMAVGIGQVALGGQAPVSAVRDGVAGAFKNVLPLVVLMICGCLAFLLIGSVLGFIAAIAIGVLYLLSHALAIILAVVLYFVAILLAYAIIMGINYAVWQHIADGSRDDTMQAVAGTDAQP